MKQSPLQAEDVKLLECVAKFGVVQDRHVFLYCQNHNYSLDPVTYSKACKRLVRAEYLGTQMIYADQDSYLMLGPRGSELMATKAVKAIPLNTINHDMLVLDLYFDLLAKNPGSEIMSERELRFSTGVKVGDKKKVPDLLMDNKIAIEVELSEKSNARLIEIINNYIADVTLTAAHYFVKSKSLGHKLLQLSGGHKKVQVFLLTSIEAPLVYTPLFADGATVPFTTTNTTAASKWSFDLDEYLQARKK